MKVTDVKDMAAQMVQQYQRADGVRQEAEKQVNGFKSPEERVDLSAKARDIQQLKDAVSDLPEIREEKVKELQERIEKGAYDVSGEKIAEKMVGESIIDLFA